MFTRDFGSNSSEIFTPLRKIKFKTRLAKFHSVYNLFVRCELVSDPRTSVVEYKLGEKVRIDAISCFQSKVYNLKLCMRLELGKFLGWIISIKNITIKQFKSIQHIFFVCVSDVIIIYKTIRVYPHFRIKNQN